MPLMSGLLRRGGASSDADIRRHSFFASESTSNPVPDFRASEQIPRRPSASEFLAPPASNAALSQRRSAEGLRERAASPIQESHKHRRFSLLRFRHASDSQLSLKARLHGQAQGRNAPPMPQPPEIITTAPTMEFSTVRSTKKKSRPRLPGWSKTSIEEEPQGNPEADVKMEKKERRKTMSESGPSRNKSRVTFDEPERPLTAGGSSPPSYGDATSSTLALPINRLSESSRSDGSSAEHGVYATTTTTTHTIHTTTTFFRLARRKKEPAPLFDLSHLPQKSKDLQSSTAPRGSLSSFTRPGNASPAVISPSSTSVDDVSGHRYGSPLPSPSHSTFGKSSSAHHPVPLLRQGSSASAQSSPSRVRLGMRGRSSTLNSLQNAPNDDPLPTPTLPSTRTSTSTGRKSFGDLFGLSHRLRQNSEPPFPRHGSGHATPASNTSKNNSMQLTREPVVLPERHDDDTPAKYLVRLEEAVSRGVVASVLSKGSDPFSQAVLRSYMRGFSFFGDPMDMAIRKLLMEVELPKETQHIDRCLQSFANRYHECNPGIYASPDQAYFIAFSLLILHTDVFNKNNKHKMQKPDYLKNTHGEGIFDEILECFYDNISYTPFIHVEDDLDINGERIIPHKVKRKTLFPRGSVDPTKRPSKGPIDPYTLIIDNQLDILRPNLKDVMPLEEQYSYLGTTSSLNLNDLQKTFFRTGILQIVSARSRPDAFMSEKTVTNPEQAHPGIVDIKITKVGLLWRKDAKKKKTRSPWQEWGTILTGAQLYFFRNTTWIKSLMHQHETHVKQGHDGIPVIFKPPLEQFKPDALMSTDDAVALLDSTYKKHKNAFIFVRHGGFEETFLADSEDEMNDWLAKLNYAATFRTSGVRMRGVVGGNYEGQRTRGIRRLESHNDSTKSIQTPTGEVTIVSGRIDAKMAQDILAARRDIMLQKISDAEEKLKLAEKQLDAQLRNARHLQILAPIQPKTREQVILAGGRMAAQLKWGRMEIWRLKCHRDILMMDLEEERKIEPSISRPEMSAHTPTSERIALDRSQSKASSSAPQQSPESASLQSSTRPNTAIPQHDRPNKEEEASSNHLDQMISQPSASGMDGRSMRKASSASTHPSSPVSTSTPLPIPATPNEDAAEQAVLQEAGFVDLEKTPERQRSGNGLETDEIKDQAGEKEKLDRGKIRRSLHRTLREAHVPTHARSRKGKESSSSAGMSEEGNKDDVLARGTGSFLVHGKKASVITFGSELQGMSPDERLRRKRHTPREESDFHSPSTGDDDTRSIPGEHLDIRERHGSAGTTSTGTAKSFRDLYKELTAHGYATSGNVVSDGEGEDSDAAISVSDERRSVIVAG